MLSGIKVLKTVEYGLKLSLNWWRNCK